MQTGRAILFIIFLFYSGMASGQEARDIVSAADRKMKGNSSYAEMKVQIVRPNYTRDIGLKAWTLGDDRLLIRITSPARDQGTAFLRRGKEVWNWIPSIERTVKLPPSMMSQAWMGSDFTNDDLVKEGSMVTDYSHSLTGKETLEGHECHRIRMTPIENATVVWGTVELWIETKESIILQAKYYDEEGALVNTMIGSDIRNLGGRMLPSRLEMKPADEPGKKTVLIYEILRFDTGIKDEFFTPKKMQKR